MPCTLLRYKSSMSAAPPYSEEESKLSSLLHEWEQSFDSQASMTGPDIDADGWRKDEALLLIKDD